MASGRLRLDFNAGGGMMMALGAVRPLIGAIFGVILFAIFDGGWLPAIAIQNTKPLAFYAVLGFLGGFNERFAQDMLVGSARQLAGAAPADANAAAAPPGARRAPGRRERRSRAARGDSACHHLAVLGGRPVLEQLQQPVLVDHV